MTSSNSRRSLFKRGAAWGLPKGGKAGRQSSDQANPSLPGFFHSTSCACAFLKLL